MRYDLAVLVIHGMGSQTAHFEKKMTGELKEWLKDLGKDPDKVVFQPVLWSDIIEPQQSAYLEQAKTENELNYLELRKFITSALGDASAYQKVSGTKNGTYKKIHDCVGENIKRLYEEKLHATSVPLIIMAHSLGAHIMSNYIWDMQKYPPDGLSDFEKMHSVSGFLTFGCNIPLFTFAFEHVEPITFPPATLPDPHRSKAKWLNYYDPDDVLAYPLKSINEAYKNTVAEDIPINVGGLFSMWNPLSHRKYWTDNDFTKPAADYLSLFL